MIIFISDLHISDGTAGPPNIHHRAYEGTFETINQMANDANAKEVTVVLLGDIFELIRTSVWYKTAEEFKPWGGWKSEEVATKIFDDIIKDPAFNSLGKFQFRNLKANKDIPTRWVYLPGNHDRLIGMYPKLQERVKNLLNLDDWSFKDGRFIRYFYESEHKVFARHGHEFDVYNFGGVAPFKAETWEEISDNDYYGTPIGDVIAAEFASALPCAVWENLGGEGNPPDEPLYRRLKDMFDLRPITAIPAFLAYQVQNAETEEIQVAITDAVHARVKYMRESPFVKDWIDAHDEWEKPFDAGDKIQAVMALLNHLDLAAAKQILPSVNFGMQFMQKKDNFLSDAALEYERLKSEDSPGQDVLHVLYGHTHHPDQELVSVTDPGPEGRPQVYINTGMWRPSQHAGKTDGFTSIKHLTYSIVYSPHERPNSEGKPKGYPTFEVWTGALKDD